MSTFDVFSLHVILKCLKEKGFLKSLDEKKTDLYLSADVFDTNVRTEDAILYVSLWKAESHF